MFRKSMWQKLYLIAAVAIVGLIVETRLNLSQDADNILLILWVVLAYGAIAIWLNSNSDDLNSSPKTPVRAPVAEFFDADRIQLQQSGVQDIDPYALNE